jgi:hypothetical protein
MRVYSGKRVFDRESLAYGEASVLRSPRLEEEAERADADAAD